MAQQTPHQYTFIVIRTFASVDTLKQIYAFEVMHGRIYP